jgi:hypothetical protein
MMAIKKRAIKNYWISTGTPAFLVQELSKQYRQTEVRNFDPQEFDVTEDLLGIFEIGATPLETIMFQTGYLTISDYIPVSDSYKLDYPNNEVRASFQKYLVSYFTYLSTAEVAKVAIDLCLAFENGDLEKMIKTFKFLFSKITYHQQTTDEKAYHALLQMACSVAGLQAQSEYATSHGRVDVTIETATRIYIIEIKLNESAETALAQIEEKRYYEPFMDSGKSITLIGLNFDRSPGEFKISYVAKEHPLV